MIVRELFARLGLQFNPEGFSAAKTALVGVRQGLMAIGVGAGAMVGALATAVKQTSEYADRVDRMAKATGIGRQALQELEHAGALSGISADEMAGSISFLNRVLSNAAGGNKEAGKTFRELGVSIYGADGKLRSADEMLEVVADRFATMPDGPRKSAMAMELFSKSGSRMVPLLSEGSAKIREMRAEAQALGIVLSDDVIDAGTRLDDSIDRANAALRGLKFTIAGPFMDGVAQVIDGMRQWFVANRQWMAQKIHAGIGLVTGAAKVLWTLLKPWVAVVKAIVTNTWVLRGALTALAVVVASQLGAAVASGVAAMSKLSGSVKALTAKQLALSAATLATNLLWFGLAALVALVAEDLYQFFTDGESVIGDFLKEWKRFYAALGEDPGFVENHPVLAFFAAMLDAILNLKRSWREFMEMVFGKGNRPGPNVPTPDQRAAGEAKAKALQAGGANDLLSFGDKLKVIFGSQYGAPGIAELPWMERIKVAFGAPGSGSAWGGPSSTGGSSQPLIGSISAPITVNPGPGMDEQALAEKVRAEVQDLVSTQLREAQAAVGP